MKFQTTIFQFRNNTGIEVPAEIVEKLGAGKKPLVVVTLNGYTYRNAIAVMEGKNLIALSAEHRSKAGVKGGDAVEVTLELDTAPRIVEVPEDLAAALKTSETAASFYETLAPSLKKKAVLLIESAKTEETRQKRIGKLIGDLELGKKP